MAFDNEYEFVPLVPFTHNSLPDEMKDFISVCGMMGIMPRSSFIHPMQKQLSEIIDLKETNDGLDIDEKDYLHEEFEDNVDEYVEKDKKELFKDVEYVNNFKTREDVLKQENELDEDTRVDKVIRSMESNNKGIFDFLEVNGMPNEMAKKFVRRVVRLTIIYNE